MQKSTTLRFVFLITWAIALVMNPWVFGQDLPSGEPQQAVDYERPNFVDASVGAQIFQPDVVVVEPEDAAVDVSAASDGDATVATDASEATEIKLSGWAEAYYSYNFNEPSNAVNAYRIFDLSHNHIAFNNLGLDVAWKVETVRGHATLQLGTLAAQGYLPSPTLSRAQQDLLWHVIQEVTFGWNPHLLGRQPLTLEAGLFVAPFGVEYIQVRQNWNWSPSNLFYMAPFQMTGVRASWEFDSHVTARAGVYSGWDRVVDDNSDRSGLLQVEYTNGTQLFLSFQYMFGVEREASEREGSAVRHTVDHYGELQATPVLGFRWHVFAGIEPNQLGINSWFGAAFYARLQILEWLFVAVRGDIVREWVPERGRSLFALDYTNTIGEATLTVELLPHRHFSIRAEYRHDQANGSHFYRGRVPRSRTTGDDVPNTDYQDTVLLGVTTWF
jgi:hypothetical protein